MMMTIYDEDDDNDDDEGNDDGDGDDHANDDMLYESQIVSHLFRYRYKR